MTQPRDTVLALRHPDKFFIGGAWVEPSSEARFGVVDSHTEEVFLTVAEAQEADVRRAVDAAYEAFHHGPWPRLSHAERAEYLRAVAKGIRDRAEDFGLALPRESGMIHAIARGAPHMEAGFYELFAGMADTFPFEEPAKASYGGFGLIVREPVGVVGAIVPWNGPLSTIVQKTAPALLAGCTVIVKSAPESPVEGLLLAEIMESVGLPPGVINFVTADRQASEALVRDPRVDKITFTGSTAAGRRIASICGERIARCTLELGGKSAAVVLDDFDIAEAAATLTFFECINTGQVCSSLTRIVVTGDRHDAMVEALADLFSRVKVGDPFEADTGMGPLVSRRQRDRVEGYIAKGISDGAKLAAGGGRPRDLDRGWYVEPTVFGDVDNGSTIAQEEIFGPVLSVIRAENEEDAVRIANESNFGLNASVFTNDLERAQAVAGQLRSGTVGHNTMATDFGIAFGGFKQSGIGREGGTEGLLPFLETKTVILKNTPDRYRL
ncbi:aldehyde dehydrogenase [Pseudofrankia inefficax]|uniref:Aldehyde Dehydrogenase n=1 Tax=Pseudofrankia inefficax (strain DSM 45817 / CECT 9037 / DDB 130130 / EuI1c) TaxID=298654 RepID=E3J905_PSEI1|nr:aldehyde dehydrogenase [Pseudofrankia inefficax]ADP80884.1 Aldehyde Dehydrogenase [Pseudofrankia inefficax]